MLNRLINFVKSLFSKKKNVINTPKPKSPVTQPQIGGNGETGNMTPNDDTISVGN
jgi:hypothetical protein